MKKLKLSLAVSALALAGCASTPENFAPLDDAQARYDSLSQDDVVARFGRENLSAAEKALRDGQRALANGQEKPVLEHYVTLAGLNLSIAEEKRDAGLAKEQISDASRERRDMMLKARERDAMLAEQAAERATARARSAEQRALSAEETALEKQQRLEAREAELQAAQAQADALAQQVAELQMQENERGLVLTLGDIVFDLNEAVLKPGGQRAVEKVAQFLQDQEDRNVIIEGFTDAQGSESYNQALSERRAQAVRNLLVETGVGSERITVKGFGEAYPVASNSSAEGRQQNRRVEIVVGDPGEAVEERS